MRRRLDLGFSVVLLNVMPELERLELERLRSELERRTSEPAPPVLLPDPGRASNPAVLLERPFRGLHREGLHVLAVGEDDHAVDAAGSAIELDHRVLDAAGDARVAAERDALELGDDGGRLEIRERDWFRVSRPDGEGERPPPAVAPRTAARRRIPAFPTLHRGIFCINHLINTTCI